MMNDDCTLLNKCIQCGTCIGSCFSGRVTALNTRKILMEFIAKGRPIEDNDTIWFCVTCYACQERCPRGIPLVDILLKARRNVIMERGLPDKLKEIFKFLYEFSAFVPAKEKHIDLRRKLNLELYHSQFIEDARNEVRSIVEKHIGGLIK